jgi:hypothetical protein
MKLLAVAVALTLVFYVVLGDDLSQECKVIWEKYPTTQVKGLTLQDSIKTEQECKTTCEGKDDCWNIDFNFRETSCWFGSQHRPQERVHDDDVHHWDMAKECHDYVVVKTQCVLKWTGYPKTQVRFLQEIPGISSEAECKVFCETKEGCWNIDFNYKDNTCWYGAEHKPPSKTPDDTVNHWDLEKICTEEPAKPTGVDCGAIHRAHPDSESGVYGLTVPGSSSLVPVYCDMDTAGGGWTVIQRRKDGSVDFQKGWADYANGFGNLNGEFWLGNEKISALTKARLYKVRFDLGYWNGTYTYAEYNDFNVAGAADKYKLTFCQCSYFGDAGDALSGAVTGPTRNHNGMKFSTIDQDNDQWADGSCSKSWYGGWWYNSCSTSRLNSQYNATGHGIYWVDNTYSLKSTEIKIRPVHY